MKNKTMIDDSKRMPRGIYKGTREEWLEESAHIMGAWIDATPTIEAKKKAYTYAGQKVRFSCSLLGAGMTKSSALAHCHYKQATGNGYHEIRMGVQIDGRKKMIDSARIADILLHEMIHTVTFGHGHKGEFRRIALDVGLEGRMTSTYAGETLSANIIDKVVRVLGKYPHKKVHLVPRGQRGKGSRSIKCTCHNCGLVMRLSRKWIEVCEQDNDADGLGEMVGCVHCPNCINPMEVE